MPLCMRCQSIPFRDLIKPSNRQTRSADDYSDYCVGTFKEVVRTAKDCGLCFRVMQFLGQEGESTEKIWLKIRAGSATVWTGENGTENMRVTPDSYAMDVLVEQGEPFSWWTHYRKIERTPFVTLTSGRIEQWLHNCEEKHTEHCSIPAKLPLLPKRVLDVSQDENKSDLSEFEFSDSFLQDSIKLVPTQGQTGKYMILSYCWGLSQPVMTTSDNFHDHQTGIQIGVLPKTIRDAVFLTRRLGIRYLWVDALCIIQNDRKDWAEQAPLMGIYYGNAYLTIAASAASDSSQGCLMDRPTEDYLSFDVPGDGPPMRIHMYTMPLPGAPGSASAYSYEGTWHDPLSQRAWVLQERLLSKRSLIFSTKAIIWECATTTIEESSAYDDGPDKTHNTIVMSDLTLERWDNVVSFYTVRDMTYATDKLPALSGLVRTLEQKYQDRCFAGVWQRDFHRSLCWKMDHSDYSRKKVSHPETWRAPSWSFMSLEGHVDYLYFGKKVKPIAEANHWHLEPVDEANLHGQLRAGHLILIAPLFALPVAPSEVIEGLVSSFPLGNELAMVTVYPDLQPVFPCYLLVILNEAALLVVPTGAPSEYRRVGVASLAYDGGVDKKGIKNGLKVGFRDEHLPVPSRVKVI